MFIKYYCIILWGTYIRSFFSTIHILIFMVALFNTLFKWALNCLQHVKWLSSTCWRNWMSNCNISFSDFATQFSFFMWGVVLSFLLLGALILIWGWVLLKIFMLWLNLKSCLVCFILVTCLFDFPGWLVVFNWCQSVWLDLIY